MRFIVDAQLPRLLSDHLTTLGHDAIHVKELPGGAGATALAANSDGAEKVRPGNMKAVGPLVGHVMRETKGRADGGEINRLIREQMGI